MKGENGVPITPDWYAEPRLAPDFTRAESKPPPCQLCRQQLDGRGDQ